MDVSAYRKAIADAVKTRLPALRACVPYAGRIDIEELKNISTQLPAIFVSVIAIPSIKADGDDRFAATVQVVLYIVAKNEAKLPAGDACLAMVGHLISWIPFNRWGFAPAVPTEEEEEEEESEGLAIPASPISCMGEPENITAENLYNDTQRNNGVCLWAIGFRQQLLLGQSAFLALPEILPEEVYLGFAPEVGPDHIDKYEKIYPPTPPEEEEEEAP